MRTFRRSNPPRPPNGFGNYYLQLVNLNMGNYCRRTKTCWDCPNKVCNECQHTLERTPPSNNPEQIKKTNNDIPPKKRTDLERERERAKPIAKTQPTTKPTKASVERRSEAGEGEVRGEITPDSPGTAGKGGKKLFACITPRCNQPMHLHCTSTCK